MSHNHLFLYWHVGLGLHPNLECSHIVALIINDDVVYLKFFEFEA